MTVLFAIIPLILLIVFFIIIGIDITLENKSPLFHLKGMSRYNHLYRHDKCERLFRFYQLDLYHKRHGEDKCPHCEEKISTYRSTLSPTNDSIYGSKRIKDVAQWMDYHTDCPKLSWKEKFKMANTLSLMNKIASEQKGIREFEEYNKLKVDLKWIENLNKSENKL